MGKLRALVFAAGRLGSLERVRRLVSPGSADLVICADGGAVHALALGLTPHLVLGDFDSLPAEAAAELTAAGVTLRTVPAAKDETDTHLALITALDRGAAEIVLLGALGPRLDHTLGNLLLLAGLPAAVAVTVVDDRNVVHLLRPGGCLELTGRSGDIVSLLPLTPTVTDIAVSGLRWNPKGQLSWGESRGISNEMVESRMSVQIGSGWLLVIQASD